MFVQIDNETLILKLVETKIFHIKQKHQYHLSKEENVFIVPNHENKIDCYVNPYSSQMKDELQF